MSFQRTKYWLPPTVLAALTACGGGGGGGGAVNDAPATVAISGTVAKGPATGAKGKIFATTAAGVKGVELASFTTVAGGKFTVNIAPQTLPILVDVDLTGADIQDETKPGTIYKGMANQTMRAAFTPVANGGATVNVTPFSEMAAALASKAGGFTPAVVQDANAKIRQILNNTDHLTADPASGVMLKQLAAVQQLVNNNPGGLTAVLLQLRDATTVVQGTTSAPTTVAVTAGLIAALESGCTATSVCGSGAFAPPALAEMPITVGSGDPIDPVRALFKDLRNTLLAYNNPGNTGDLDVAGQKLTDAVAAAVQPVDEEMLGVLAMAQKGDRMFRAFKAGTSTQQFSDSGQAYGQRRTFDTAGNSVPAGPLARYGCELAKATVVTNTDGTQDVGSDYTTVGVTSANVNVFACYGFGTQGRLAPGLGDGYGYHQASNFIPQPDGSWKYVHQVRKTKLDQTGLASTASSRVRAVYGNVVLTRDVSNEITGFNLTGKLMPGLKGHTSVDYPTLDRVDANLNYAFTKPTNDTDKVTLSGSMKLYKGDGSLASSVEIASGTMAESQNVTSAYGSTNELSKLNLDVTVAAPGVKFQGIVTADTPSFDSTNSVYVPTKMSLQGKIYEADGAGYRLLLDGTGTIEAVNYAGFNAVTGGTWPKKVGFNGKVLIKERPEMGITLTGASSAAGDTGTGTFFWNSKTLRFELKADQSLVVSNDGGAHFTIPKNGNAMNQDIFNGNVKVGTINVDRARIDYIDGTFEQF